MPDHKKLLFQLGRPFSPFYSGLMSLRAALYQRGFLRRYQMTAPVISVGNLTMGGSGKTPVVSHLARFLQEQGYRPAIISRGYGGAAGNKVNVVSDGTTIFLDAGQAGDEPRMLAETLPGIPVLTGIVRALPCRHAIESLGCDILLLDDGFQHLAVKRDINIVLFAAETLAGNSRVFPGGDLREPVAALGRADVFLLTGANPGNRERADRFAELLRQRFPGRPVFLSSYLPSTVTDLHTQNTMPLSALPAPLYGFCGIARPEAFQQTLSDQGCLLSGFTALRDHQRYSSSLIASIEKKALASGAQALITTAKDRIKLTANSFNLALYCLEMRARIDEGLLAFILKKLQKDTRS
jgi:tetraacyldisaccharide 4'-kinase